MRELSVIETQAVDGAGPREFGREVGAFLKGIYDSVCDNH